MTSISLPAGRQPGREPHDGAGLRATKVISLNGFLTVVALLAVLPFVLMVFGGFKTSGQLASNPAGIPTHPTIANFHHLVTGYSGATFIRGFANALIVTIPHTLLSVLLCAMAGYAFAKFEFPGRTVLFAALIGSMLVPVEVNIPPLYIMFAKIHWLDTYKVQIIPGTANVLGMFLVRQYMSAIPNELLEAARLDGASQWRIFTRIVMPLARPALGAVGLLVAIAKWTDYLWPQVMVSSPKKLPIMVLLPSLSTSPESFIIPYELVLAGAALVTLPMLALFLKYQDKLMSGTISGAVRG